MIPGTDSTPRDFYDGFFKATQMTSNIDINRDVDIGLAGPLNVAFGGEFRRSAYAIGAGDPNSYIGSGAQSYPGFQPADASIHSRKNYAGYVDLSTKPIDQLRVDLAGRFEHYDDFGSKAVGKLTARYDVIPEFGIRGTVSTGFRAPTLAEEYYRATNVSPDSATVQLQPNSKSAADLGLGGLKPETSRNYSVGLALQPLPGITATIDAYWIDINDRVVASGTLNSVVNGQLVSPAIATAIADSGAVPPSLVVPGGRTLSACSPMESIPGQRASTSCWTRRLTTVGASSMPPLARAIPRRGSAAFTIRRPNWQARFRSQPDRRCSIRLRFPT